MREMVSAESANRIRREELAGLRERLEEMPARFAPLALEDYEQFREAWSRYGCLLTDEFLARSRRRLMELPSVTVNEEDEL